ncbi:MAG: phosphoribosylformylglycinamidine synthase subunit PurQ [Fimbriimonas sp.]|nr:phosphoribosylformylglycinamidine synthase subunit PurQ [Fimbriimonas sp.]
MKVAVLQFPGSNCDQDALKALREDVGVQAEYVWHNDGSLSGFDAVFVPGGFSYGDYLRCGAMASRSAIMQETIRFANEGRPVIGACNGFQILTESGLLPGALLKNEKQKFVCKNVELEAVNQTSIWTSGVNKTISLPIAHGEGRYVIDTDGLKRLQDQNQIAFRYVENPNGSVDNIAGVVNEKGNVLGLMPHPERATKELLGGNDGLLILRALSLVNA